MSGQPTRGKSFKATDDKGNEHELDVFVSLHYTQSASGSLTAVGIPEIKTKDGLDVNALGGGEYQVVKTGVILRSDDPDAP